MNEPEVILTTGSQEAATFSFAQAPSKELQKGMSGLYAVMLAVSNGIPALQRLMAKGFMGLSVVADSIGQAMSRGWADLMGGPAPTSDLSRIQQEVNSGEDPDTMKGKLSALNTIYQQHSTLRDASNTFYANLNNALNLASSQVNNLLSLLLTFYEKGPQAAQKALNKIL